jgi:PAS domain S-box-containing protein
MTNEKRGSGARSGTPRAVLPEDKFEVIFQLANDIIVYVDTRGRIVDINGKVRGVLGYAPEEVKGKDFTKFGFISLKDAPRILKLFWDAVKKGKVEDTTGRGSNALELELKHKDGSRVQVEASTAEVRSDGRLTGFVSVIRDLSGLRRADQRWIESEARYRELFEDMTSGVAVYRAKDGGKDFVFKDFNRAGEQMEGVKREKLIGKTISQVFPNLEEFTLLETFRRVSRTGEPAERIQTVVCRVGEIVGWRENRIHRLPNGDIVSIFDDVTERHQAMQALQDLKRSYEDLFNNSPIGIYRTTPDGRILMANPALTRMLGYSSCEELAERNLEEEGFEPSYPRSRFKEIMDSKGEVVGLETAWMKKDGSIIFVRENAKAIRGQQGNILCYEGTVEDVTEKKRAEQDLKRERDFSRSILQTANSLILCLDADGAITVFNDECEKVTGYRREEVLGKPWADLFLPPEKRHPGLKHFAEWVRAHPRDSYEGPVLTRSGEIRTILWSNSSIIGSKRTDVTAIAIGWDITEHKRAEQALRASEERHRTLFEGSLHPITIYDHDANIVMLNKVGAENLKKSLQEIIGKPLREFVPETHELTVKRVRQVLDTGQPLSVEDEISLPDGRRWFLSTLHPVSDPKGRPHLVQVISYDITERKRAEEALRLSEDRLKKAQAIAHIGSWDWNIKEGTLSWSDQLYSIFGVDRSTFEPSYESVESLIHPEDIESNNRQVKRLLEEADSGEYSFRAVRPDGEIRHLNQIFEVVRDRKGTAVRAFGTIQDVTERARLVRQLIQSEKTAAVGTLAYGIAHEFNNILAGIMANAEYGLSSDDVNQIKECLKIIVENSQRGSSITNSLLAVAGEKKRKRELANVRQALENVLSFSHRELEKAGIRVIQDLKDVPEIRCDPGEFSEVFLNMINNARDAMTPEGGTLTVKIDHTQDNIRIAFEDTGCGISEEITDRIFDAFVTTKGALGKSEVPGTGLGLFVSRGIVDGYGGRIEVRSRPGRGTRFTVTIPVTPNLPSEPVSKEEIGAWEETGAKLNVLLIDDEETICRVLKRFLESKGHRVVASLDPKKALELFEEGKFDVVLSDITMPGMDGIELIRGIKERDKASRIIAITGHVRQDTLDRAREAGAQDILIKPFRSGELYESILRLHRDAGRKNREKGAAE